MVVLSELYPVSVSTSQNVPVAQPPGLNQPIGALKEFLHRQELTYLNRALAQTGEDKEKAAELLGISLATLYRKLAEAEEAT